MCRSDVLWHSESRARKQPDSSTKTTILFTSQVQIQVPNLGFQTVCEYEGESSPAHGSSGINYLGRVDTQIQQPVGKTNWKERGYELLYLRRWDRQAQIAFGYKEDFITVEDARDSYLWHPSQICYLTISMTISLNFDVMIPLSCKSLLFGRSY